VHCAATHGLLSGDAVETLNAAPLHSLAVMDTVDDVAVRCAGLRCAVHVLDSAEVFARAFTEWAAERNLVQPPAMVEAD
jgi:phosphoribosylpyrophosphate synthetase